MPLPSTFSSAELYVDGQRYRLSNIAVTSQNFEREFGSMRGMGGAVITRTQGRLTERVSLEAELVELPAQTYAAAVGAVEGAWLGRVVAVEPDPELRERVRASITSSPTAMASGEYLAALAETFGVSREPVEAPAPEASKAKTRWHWMREAEL